MKNLKKLQAILVQKGYNVKFAKKVTEDRSDDTSHTYEVNEIENTEPIDFHGVSWTQTNELIVLDEDGDIVTDELFDDWIEIETFIGTYEEGTGKLSVEHVKLDDDDIQSLIDKINNI